MDEVDELRAGLRVAEHNLVRVMVRWWDGGKVTDGAPLLPGTLSVLRDRNEYRERLIAMGEPDPDNEAKS